MDKNYSPNSLGVNPFEGKFIRDVPGNYGVERKINEELRIFQSKLDSQEFLAYREASDVVLNS